MGDSMNMKQARKETRGMLTRIEKSTDYLFKAWDNERNAVVDGREQAPSVAKLATFLRNEKNLILLEIIGTETTMVMYAVDATDFQDLAAKSGKVIFIEKEN